MIWETGIKRIEEGEGDDKGAEEKKRKRKEGGKLLERILYSWTTKKDVIICWLIWLKTWREIDAAGTASGFNTS